jgi:alkaline phosphatase D
MPRLPVYERTLARLSRRDLLALAWYLGASAVATPLTARRGLAQPLFTAYPFSLGVASGDPLPDGVVLWTRLAPSWLDGGGVPMAPVEVSWEVAHDWRVQDVVKKGTTTAFPEVGHSVHVEVNGLEPSREYWYRFRAGREVSPTGRTKTAPAAGAAVDRLRFAVCGCSHYEQGLFTGYRRIAEEAFDFVFHTGDYLYEGRADGGQNDGRVRQHVGSELYTLVDYRNRYGQYKSDADLRAAHQSAPFVMSWDDHEVDDNYASDVDREDTAAALFLLRRAAAYQAYYEHMPLRLTAFPTGAGMRIYRRLQFGSLIDLSVLDTRQYRSNQACGDGQKTSCAEALDPRRTMLGDEQEGWLFDNLATARARWTVIGQQVYSFARDIAKVNPSGRFSMDAWDGYAGARQRLYTRLKETRAPNPVVLSGDVHVHFGADLKLDYTDPRSETVGVELTNTSISAGGDGSDVAENWNATKADNPHIKYHSARRGYIACTATPATMEAEFKTLDRVTAPGAPVKTAGTLVVQAGRPGASVG